ncbi:hypothetical protein ElyMa_001913700 [Elysia marginata]|uniref:Uncharacterized protein n=1 Tax=Elysia marginata TaxID=1093978 RepID=A0AAV4ET97_9GAST|nr:hypothetical protein ElyMa_001913700 [Elysia marginata]
MKKFSVKPLSSITLEQLPSPVTDDDDDDDVEDTTETTGECNEAAEYSEKSLSHERLDVGDQEVMGVLEELDTPSAHKSTVNKQQNTIMVPGRKKT